MEWHNRLYATEKIRCDACKHCPTMPLGLLMRIQVTSLYGPIRVTFGAEFCLGTVIQTGCLVVNQIRQWLQAAKVPKVCWRDCARVTNGVRIVSAYAYRSDRRSGARLFLLDLQLWQQTLTHISVACSQRCTDCVDVGLNCPLAW